MLHGSPLQPGRGLAGASLHRLEVGPLLHHPAIGKSADAVLASRAFANLALAAALGAEYRRRIRKRPRALRADDQHGNEDQPDRSPHLIRSPLRLRHSITWSRSAGRKRVAPLKPTAWSKTKRRSRTRLLPVSATRAKPSSRGRCAVFCRLGPREILRPGCPRSSAAHPWPWAAGDRSAPV